MKRLASSKRNDETTLVISTACPPKLLQSRRLGACVQASKIEIVPIQRDVRKRSGLLFGLRHPVQAAAQRQRDTALSIEIRRAAASEDRSVSHRKAENESWILESISWANLARLKVDEKEEVKLVGKERVKHRSTPHFGPDDWNLNLTPPPATSSDIQQQTHSQWPPQTPLTPLCKSKSSCNCNIN